MAETTAAFTERLGLATAHVTLMQMLYVAHRLNLLDTMHAFGPISITSLALQMGLKARYLRELIHSLTCHGVLDMHAQESGGEAFYAVPQRTVETLLATAKGSNFTAWPIFLNVTQSVIEGVLAAFPESSTIHGVPFSDMNPEIVTALDLMSGPGMPESLPQVIATSGHLTTALGGAEKCLDVGCGSGSAVLVLAGQFPQCQFTGIDVSVESIARANIKLAASGLKNASFEVRDLQTLRDADWDVITTFDVIHDIPQSTAAVAHIRRALREGGTYLMVEPGVSSRVEDNLGPRGGFLYGVSLLHCLTQNLAHDGEGHGAAWGTERQLALLLRAGFAAEQIEKLDFSHVPPGRVPNHFVCRK